MPEDHAPHAPNHHPPHAELIDQSEPPRPGVVQPRHAASLVVLRQHNAEPGVLMGMRGARHRFMPNRLVFPGGAVDRIDLDTPSATPLAPHTERLLRKAANARLAHGLGMAAARELEEETGLTLGSPPRLHGLDYLCRAVTPADSPIRFNARFLLVAEAEVSGTLGGDGELENLRFLGLQEALAIDLAGPTRMVLRRVQAWLEMTDEQRRAVAHTPLLRDRGPITE
ncbi:MAG TPA: NUDIX hydrolase [Acetobacteraceae bacterium]|nr:NUDIX hydrolase [Acetobacteraceae bacterium]